MESVDGANLRIISSKISSILSKAHLFPNILLKLCFSRFVSKKQPDFPPPPVSRIVGGPQWGLGGGRWVTRSEDYTSSLIFAAAGFDGGRSIAGSPFVVCTTTPPSPPPHRPSPLVPAHLQESLFFDDFPFSRIPPSPLVCPPAMRSVF